MPVLDARALDTDPEGMALLADVLRPAKRARRRKALRRWPAPEAAEPPRGRPAGDLEPLDAVAPKVLITAAD